ncbi:MAG: TIGR02996 domain-containing protein [Gemmataceae bacterium]
MTDGEALFRAILDDPDDDLPRLAYADWLEEGGEQPRAQLIRLMCEAARLAPSRDPADRRRCEAATAEYCALLTKHEARWLAELPGLEGMEWGAGEKTRFLRGFAHAVTAPDAAALAAGGDQALAASPVEWLRIDRRVDGRLGDWPGMRRVARLDLRSAAVRLDDWVHGLRNSPHFRRLRWLQVRALSLVEAAALMDAPWFADVERFEAPGLVCDAGPPVPLPPRPRLRYLDFSDSRLTPGLLGGVPTGTFPNLARLHLAGCQLGDAGAELIASTNAARPLRHLDLSRNGISARGAVALATTPLLDGLELLDLRYNPIPPGHRRRLRDRFDHDDCRLLLDGEGQP